MDARLWAVAWCFSLAAGHAGSLHAADGDGANAAIEPTGGSQVRGEISFRQTGDRVRITGQMRGLTPGPHGFHLHEKGDCSAADASSAGGHFNPGGGKHGGARSKERHAGDFGNVMADATGAARIDIVTRGLSISRDRPDGVIGRGLVVHAQADDERSDPAGNSGGRVGCGVVKQ